MNRLITIITAFCIFGITSPVIAAENCKTAAKIPAIVSMEYLKAREKLNVSGWKPLHILLSTKDNPSLLNAASLIDKGVIEVQKCDSLSNECAFGFRDKNGNFLFVSTKSGFEHTVQKTVLICMAEHKEWDDRATVVSKLLVTFNADDLSKKIQSIAHPSGSSPSVAGMQVAKYGDHVSVEISVKWNGGFTGNPYLTTLAWDYSKNSHISVTIKSDSASTAVAASNLNTLNSLFQNELYPLARAAFEE